MHCFPHTFSISQYVNCFLHRLVFFFLRVLSFLCVSCYIPCYPLIPSHKQIVGISDERDLKKYPETRLDDRIRWQEERKIQASSYLACCESVVSALKQISLSLSHASKRGSSCSVIKSQRQRCERNYDLRCVFVFPEKQSDGKRVTLGGGWKERHAKRWKEETRSSGRKLISFSENPLVRLLNFAVSPLFYFSVSDLLPLLSDICFSPCHLQHFIHKWMSSRGCVHHLIPLIQFHCLFSRSSFSSAHLFSSYTIRLLPWIWVQDFYFPYMHSASRKMHSHSLFLSLKRCMWITQSACCIIMIIIVIMLFTHEREWGSGWGGREKEKEKEKRGQRDFRVNWKEASLLWNQTIDETLCSVCE